MPLDDDSSHLASELQGNRTSTIFHSAELQDTTQRTSGPVVLDGIQLQSSELKDLLDGDKMEQMKQRKLTEFCREHFNLSTNMNNLQSSAYRYIGDQTAVERLKFGDFNKRFIKEVHQEAGDAHARKPAFSGTLSDFYEEMKVKYENRIKYEKWAKSKKKRQVQLSDADAAQFKALPNPFGVHDCQNFELSGKQKKQLEEVEYSELMFRKSKDMDTGSMEFFIEKNLDNFKRRIGYIN